MVHVIRLDNDGKSEKLYANKMADRDDMEIIVCGNEEKIVISSRYDNLGKGASGAAIQCMNIMLGLEETTSLVKGNNYEK
jgi:N-acetyl-gamma-glutamyl-phosphate reductase